MNNLTPRPYLSFSQISCLKYSEQKYIQNYIYGKREQENYFLKLGKFVHTELEKRKKDSELIDIIKKIPKYKKRELEIKTQLRDIPLFGIIDGLNEKPLQIADYKTGLKPNLKTWKEQLTFYNLMLWQERKEIAEKNNIYFIKTKWSEDEQLILDGDVREYEIKIELRDIIEYTPVVIDSWNTIKKLVDHERIMFGQLPFEKNQ